MKQFTTRLLVLLTAFLMNVNLANSQELIAVIQDGNVVLLNAFDGTIQDPSFIVLDAGTPKALIQVGGEIWISYQIGDKIERYDLEGSLLSTIEGGLDNIKGMALINNSEVWVTNAGTQNSAPGNAIVKFDLDGNNLGFFLTDGVSSFDIVDNGDGEVYISYIGASTSKIERRDYDGNILGNIVGPGVVNFIQQIEIEEPGVIIAAVFSVISGGNQNGLYRFSESDGSIIDFWNEGNLRGVAKLGNGELLWSSGAGVHKLNPSTGVSTLISAGSAQYFGSVLLEECTNHPDAPTGVATQTHCSGDTVANLEATGQNIQWYTTPTGGTPLAASEPLVSGSYYATQTVDGCESQDRFEVTVTLVSPETPAGDSPQSFEQGSTLADIVITPADVSWFATEADALAGNNPLPLSTVLVDGETYYAVNIVGDCLSEPTPVTVAINLSTNDFDSSNFTFYPNPTDGIVHLVYNKSITGVTVSNLLGQIVLNKEYNSNQVDIDLSTLPNGVYLLRLKSENGSKVIKVVKK
jgi:hypothetical protein